MEPEGRREKGEGRREGKWRENGGKMEGKWRENGGKMEGEGRGHVRLRGSEGPPTVPTLSAPAHGRGPKDPM
jgi:hypothetical protein